MNTTNGLLVVLSNAVVGRDDEFNEWYEKSHVPHMLSVPGIVSCTRARFSPVEITPGAPLGTFEYIAIYGVEADDDAGFEKIAAALRRAFLGGQAVEASAVFTSGVTNDEMPLSEALDVSQLCDTFASVLSRA